MGSVYRPKLKSGRPSTIWWVKCYVNGRPVRESTGTEKETNARRFLKERDGRVATGASSTSPPTSNPLLWLRWNGCGRWSARLGRSFRTCTLTSLANTGANGSRTS